MATGLAPHDPAPSAAGSDPEPFVRAPGSAPVAHPLVPHQVGEPELDRTLDQRLLAAGGSADVYALDEHRVLRRYRGDRDVADEAAIMRHLHAHDFPVPAVHHAHGPDLEMERLHGPTLLQALTAGEVTIGHAAALMAELHARLHTIAPPTPYLAADGDVVVHGDVHPGNIVLTEDRGPMLLDWANAGPGSAELDIAMTALLFAEVAVDAGGVYSEAARVLLADFLRHAPDPRPALDAAAGRRSCAAGLVPGEKELVPAAAELVAAFAGAAHES